MFACAECTKGKRKCSKESPKCERCRRLNKPCKYPNVDPKYRGLEDKIKKIEGEFQLVKNIISGSHLDLYTELIQVHMKYFSNFLPFISETRILSILPKKYHTSPLINAICIQPYQNLLYKKYPDKKAFLLKDNPFYQRTEELTPDQLEAFSIEIIQTLLLLAFLECGEGEFAIATIHLTQAIKKAQVLELNKACSKRLDQDSDLQTEYIATWSMCVFVDTVVSNFYAKPSIVHLPKDFENLHESIREGKFINPHFEFDNIDTSTIQFKEGSEYINLITQRLDLKFNNKQSELLLQSVFFETAAQLVFYCFWLKKCYEEGKVNLTMFLGQIEKCLSLLTMLIPLPLRDNFLLNIRSCSENERYFYYHFYIFITLLRIFVRRSFRFILPDDTIFDIQIYNDIEMVYKILNQLGSDLIEVASFFLGSFSTLSVFWMIDKPHFKSYTNLTMAYDISYRCFKYWPYLFNILKTRIHSGNAVETIKQTFPEIEKYPLAYDFFS